VDDVADKVMADILVMNGPNLNMLGTREPHIYGHMTLDEIEAASREKADNLGLTLDWFWSNSEGAIITRLQQASQNARAIIINAAAYTHTSFAVRDALALFDGPKVEVHLSKNFKRESFRQISTISPVCDGTIVGFGLNSYLLGIQAVEGLLNAASEE
jgi:3-dehydroquinate dehydratase-2